MTQQEKREQKLNKVLAKINSKVATMRESEKKKSILHRLGIIHFCYSCGRLNDLQVIVRLSSIARDLKIDENSVITLLED